MWTLERYAQHTRWLVHRQDGFKRIACARLFGDKLRLTVFRPDGPSEHMSFVKVARLNKEIEREWIDYPLAGLRLDKWSKTEAWAIGIKQCRFVQTWNMCSRHGAYWLCHLLDDAPSLDAAIDMIPRVLALLRIWLRGTEAERERLEASTSLEIAEKKARALERSTTNEEGN